LIPNPIHKVLSTLSTHQVRYLLMGGQACVFYGAAEFSRDCDVAVLCDRQNLDRLQAALDDLAAVPIAVPTFSLEYLQRGHAVHFRCQAPEAAEIRIDVMARLRGVALFDELWPRRTTIEGDEGLRIEIMALPDLVAAKKTQRDKDWPMLRRLVEANYAQYKDNATDEQVRFWLRESRTPEMLVDLASRYPEIVQDMARQRPLLTTAAVGDRPRLTQSLAEEESREREADRAYWEPLKRELQQMRRAKRPPE
jgi:hypothetical protein